MQVTYFYDLLESSYDLQGYFQKIGHRHKELTITEHITKPFLSAKNGEG